MKFRSIAKWDDPAASAPLLYFAQILDEMLFDFSLDTYKASVMSTSLLCMEALDTLEQIEAGNIRTPNIWHVTAELCSNFDRDLVAKSLVSLPSSAFYAALKNPKTPLKDLKNVLEILAVHLGSTKYRERNEELLASEILGRQSFTEIRRLARSYITTLRSMGFSQRYMRDMVQGFFYGRDRIGDSGAIREFFQLFPNDRQKYDVVFRVNKIFESVAEAFAPLSFTITKLLPAAIDINKFPSFSPAGDHQLYVVVSEVQARDVYSARSVAERLLKLCSTFLSIFHHKEEPTWLSESIVIDSVDGGCKKVQKRINSMHKCSDLIQPVASKRLQIFMNNFSLEHDSFSKFIRSAQLHSMALRSDVEENQVLNLWISLESLVPSETKGEDVSSIEHIVSSIIPFLNVGYINRLLNNLVKDLLRWNPNITRRVLRLIPGKKFINKITKLMVLAEFEGERIAFEASFGDFHLLRDRFAYLRSVSSSPSSVLAALDAHRVRLEWQIRRIYRTRNIIVHSGDTPGYTRLLIEHTHDYLDNVLSTLVNLASEPKMIHSVGQGFKFVELKYNNYCKRLEEKGLSFDVNNIDSLLFDG